MAKEQPRTVGWGTCKYCGLENQPVKESSKGHLYFICAAEADGGCNHQTFARGATSDRHLALQVTRWKTKEERARWLQDEPEPEPVDDPEPEPQDDPEPVDDPPPPPSRKRIAAPPTPAKPKSKRPQPPQLAKARPKKLFGGLIEW